MASSIQKIDNAIASINKGSDKKEEMRMMMAPYADWDRFLAPAPMTIALLGQLILVSAETDFSLQDQKKEIQFKHLKFPGSFRACLVQVCNKGWGAFNKAHTNMDQIRLYSGNVDGHVRTAVKFLVTGTSQEVELLVPNALESIGNIADKCVALATSVEEEFVSVMELVGELLEACTRAKGQYDDEHKKTTIAIEVANENRKAMEQQKNEAEKKRQEMMRQMKDAEESYKEAMDSVPSAGDIVGLAAADLLREAGKQAISMAPMMVPMMMMQQRMPAGQQQPMNVDNPGETTGVSDRPSTQQGDLNEVSSFVRKIKIQTAMVQKLSCGKESEGGNQPMWDKIGSATGAEKVKLKIRDLLKDMPETKQELQEKLGNYLSVAMEICEKLLELKGAINRDEEEVSKVVSRALQLSKDVETVNSALRMAHGGNSLPNKSPFQAKAPAEIGNDDSLIKTVLHNARFKTETAKQNLTETRQNYDKSCQQFDERMQRMGDILAELAAYNPKKLDLEMIRETLIKGIRALGELREQWGKLVQFFQMLSNLIKVSLESSLKQFVGTAQSHLQLTDRGLAMSNTMRDVLFEQAFKANQIAYVVNSISGAYTEVSGKHLMDRITCLGKLVALDPVKDKQEMINMREELNEGCKEAQEAIKTISKRKKKEMDEAFKNRIGRIEQEVEAIMPPMPKAEIQEIELQVKSAMKIKKVAIGIDLDGLV